MNDTAIVESILGTLKHHGINATRHNIDACITVILQDRDEFAKRLEVIKNKADITLVNN